MGDRPARWLLHLPLPILSVQLQLQREEEQRCRCRPRLRALDSAYYHTATIQDIFKSSPMSNRCENE